MSTDARFERLLADVLSDSAPAIAPDQLVPNILAAALRTRRMPRWLALATVRPMRLRADLVVGSPGIRVVYILALTLFVASAVVGVAVVGARLLQGPNTLIAPERGVFSSTGSLASARRDFTATLLPDGRVLIVGGSGSDAPIGSAELWDPATGRFTRTGSLARARGGHTATLLPDGKVLVVGGGSATSAELWDPSTGSFTEGGSLADTRRSHSATLLGDGRVLIVGGWARRPFARRGDAVGSGDSVVYADGLAGIESLRSHRDAPAGRPSPDRRRLLGSPRHGVSRDCRRRAVGSGHRGIQ